MRKKKLKVLAHAWLRRSDDDEVTMRLPTFANIKPELKAMVRVRRNCAWELLQLLREAETENPSVEGPLCPFSTECESV